MIQILICSISYTFQPDLVWKVKARRMVYRRVKHCGQWRKWPTTHTRIMWSRDASQRLWKLNWISDLIMSLQTTISPHNQQPLVSKSYPAKNELDGFIIKAREAQKSWSNVPLKERVAIGYRFMVRVNHFDARLLYSCFV